MAAINSECLKTTATDMHEFIHLFATGEAGTEKAHLLASLVVTEFFQTKFFSLWFSLIWKYTLR